MLSMACLAGSIVGLLYQIISHNRFCCKYFRSLPSAHCYESPTSTLTPEVNIQVFATWLILCEICPPWTWNPVQSGTDNICCHRDHFKCFCYPLLPLLLFFFFSLSLLCLAPSFKPLLTMVKQILFYRPLAAKPLSSDLITSKGYTMYLLSASSPSE